MTDQDKELQNQPQDPDPNSQDSWQEGPKEQAPQNDWQAQPQDQNPQSGWQNQPQNPNPQNNWQDPPQNPGAKHPPSGQQPPYGNADSRLTGRTLTAMGSRPTGRTPTAMGSRLTDRTLTATGSSLTGRTPTAMDSRPTDRITPTAAAPGLISRIGGPNRPGRKTAMRPFPLYPGSSAC